MKTPSIALAALSFLMFLAGCHLAPSVTAVEAAVEYRVDRVEFQHDPPNGLQDYLNQMSKDGWRLVQFVEHDDWYRVVMSRRTKG